MSMKNRWLALLLVGVAAGCTPAPVPSAGASIAPPVATTGPSAPASSELAAAAEIQALVDRMAAAVLAGDRGGYLALVDLADPVFALEHTRWADDWSSRNPVSTYSLEVADMRQDGESATGLLTVNWAFDPSVVAQPPRVTTYPVGFS